jgi:hypothetical protein
MIENFTTKMNSALEKFESKDYVSFSEELNQSCSDLLSSDLSKLEKKNLEKLRDVLDKITILADKSLDLLKDKQ